MEIKTNIATKKGILNIIVDVNQYFGTNSSLLKISLPSLGNHNFTYRVCLGICTFSEVNMDDMNNKSLRNTIISFDVESIYDATVDLIDTLMPAGDWIVRGKDLSEKSGNQLFRIIDAFVSNAGASFNTTIKF